MKLLKSCFAIILSLVFYCHFMYAQQVCPIKIVTVKSLSGRIVDAGRDAVPIKRTKLELRRIENEELVATVLTDENGFFEFNKLSKGSYRLSAYFLVNGLEVVPKFDIVVKLRPSHRSNHDQGLIIKLGPTCFESSVDLSPKNDTDLK
jgi:hypothetical protein